MLARIMILVFGGATGTVGGVGSAQATTYHIYGF